MSVSTRKSKTGCITCRIRKVKCDERKPACERCLSTGRTCDGYRSNFRIIARTESGLSAMSQPISSFQFNKPTAVFPCPEHVEYLSKHFTIKPVSSMGVGNGKGISYEAEARATLSATSEPAVHHALAALSVLRKAYYEQPSLSFPSAELQFSYSSPGVQHGIKEYSHAIKSLSMRILNNNASSIKSALLCCQMFMSIELGLGDFSSAIQHFIRGLRIMHECLSRPYIREDGSVIAAQYPGMPAVDVFTIKLFLTPCPDGLTNDFLLASEVGPRVARVLLAERAAAVQANMRLANLGRFTLHLLKGISQLSPTSSASNLVRDRSIILEQLQKWKDGFGAIERSRVCQRNARARLGMTFSTFFFLVLKVVATLAIRPTGFEMKNMESIFDELLAVAHELNHLKLEAYQRQLNESGQGRIVG